MIRARHFGVQGHPRQQGAAGRLATREVGQPEDMSSLIARIAHTRPGTSLAQIDVFTDRGAEVLTGSPIRKDAVGNVEVIELAGGPRSSPT